MGSIIVSMTGTTFQERRRFEALDGAALVQHQLSRLNGLLHGILPQNRFYADKLSAQFGDLADRKTGAFVNSLDELAKLPFTFKEELLSTDPSHLAVNLTYPKQDYVRFHQTSGTRGRPLGVLDTAAD